MDNKYSNYHEYTKFRLENNTTDLKNKPQKLDTIFIDGIEIPAEINWNKKENFTPVKDQGDCNACYAFGAISGVEAH